MCVMSRRVVKLRGWAGSLLSLQTDWWSLLTWWRGRLQAESLCHTLTPSETFSINSHVSICWEKVGACSLEGIFRLEYVKVIPQAAVQKVKIRWWEVFVNVGRFVGRPNWDLQPWSFFYSFFLMIIIYLEWIFCSSAWVSVRLCRKRSCIIFLWLALIIDFYYQINTSHRGEHSGGEKKDADVLDMMINLWEEMWERQMSNSKNIYNMLGR